MANTRISNLTASASNLASTDLAPVVQTVGVGPVKMTGLQLAGGLLGSTTFNGATSAGTALGTVAITGTGGQFSCAAATLAVGQNVTISGTLGGTGSITGYSSPTTYTISSTNGSTTFTLVNASTGAALTTTAGTPTGLTYVVTSPVVNFTQTWNNSNVTFTGLKFNATDTASASGSLLLDLQLGKVSQFAVAKNKTLVSGSQSNTVPQLAGMQNPTTGLCFGISGDSSVGFILNGTLVAGFFSDPRLAFSSSMQLQWTNGGAQAASDTILSRAAAATLQLGAADASASATVTITIATPGVVTWNNHGLSTGTPVVFSTTGALPTGITAGTTYYVIAVNANTFQIATSYANATAVSPTAVNTSGSQSGTHTGTRGAVDQVFRVQSASGTSNFPGADFAIQGSRGTGTGAGGSIIFQVAPAGSSGTAQNAYSTALTIASDRSATFAGTTINLADDTNINAKRLTFSQSNTAVIFYNFGISYSSGGAWNGILGYNGSEYKLGLSSVMPIVWSSGTSLSGFGDLYLYRDTTSTLALRNGNSTGAAQRFNVYNTYTSSTNYETFKIDWITTANTCLIGTEKGSGGGTARALALQTDGTTRLTIETNGDLTIADAKNIIVGSTTGTKIGTATSQKIGFWNATPIVQPTTGVAEAAFVENSGGTAVNVDSTFGGYTLQQVVQALQNAGLLA